MRYGLPKPNWNNGVCALKGRAGVGGTASNAVSSADSAASPGMSTTGVALSNSAVSGSMPSAKIVSMGVSLGSSVSASG